MLADGRGGIQTLTKSCQTLRHRPVLPEGEKKLEISVVHGTGSQVLLDAVIKPLLMGPVKAESKEGRAPRGNLERQIQDLIDELGGDLKHD